MDWQALLTSNAAVTCYIAIALYVYRLLQIKYKWETERWEGIIATAFTLAEKSGAISGNAKLDFALKVFNTKFKDTYGHEPDRQDIQDAVLDFGRLAFDLKFAPKKA